MKKINIKVIPNARKVEVVPDGDRFIVRVKAPAVGGKANKAVIEALAGYFNTNNKSVNIVQGLRSRKKVVELENYQ